MKFSNLKQDSSIPNSMISLNFTNISLSKSSNLCFDEVFSESSNTSIQNYLLGKLAVSNLSIKNMDKIHTCTNPHKTELIKHRNNELVKILEKGCLLITSPRNGHLISTQCMTDKFLDDAGISVFRIPSEELVATNEYPFYHVYYNTKVLWYVLGIYDQLVRSDKGEIIKIGSILKLLLKALDSESHLNTFSLTKFIGYASHPDYSTSIQILSEQVAAFVDSFMITQGLGAYRIYLDFSKSIAEFCQENNSHFANIIHSLSNGVRSPLLTSDLAIPSTVIREVILLVLQTGGIERGFYRQIVRDGLYSASRVERLVLSKITFCKIYDLVSKSEGNIHCSPLISPLTYFHSRLGTFDVPDERGILPLEVNEGLPPASTEVSARFLCDVFDHMRLSSYSDIISICLKNAERAHDLTAEAADLKRMLKLNCYEIAYLVRITMAISSLLGISGSPATTITGIMLPLLVLFRRRDYLRFGLLVRIPNFSGRDFMYPAIGQADVTERLMNIRSTLLSNTKIFTRDLNHNDCVIHLTESVFRAIQAGDHNNLVALSSQRFPISRGDSVTIDLTPATVPNQLDIGAIRSRLEDVMRATDLRGTPINTASLQSIANVVASSLSGLVPVSGVDSIQGLSDAISVSPGVQVNATASRVTGTPAGELSEDNEPNNPI